MDLHRKDFIKMGVLKMGACSLPRLGICRDTETSSPRDKQNQGLYPPIGDVAPISSKERETRIAKLQTARLVVLNWS